MKKLAVTLVGILMCVSLCACGNSNDSKVISGDVNNTTTNAQNEGGSNENANSTENAVKGYVFGFNGTDIVIDANADSIIASLGEPKSYYEAPSCAFNGLDKIYTYSSFEVDTYPADDKDFISGVILKDDTVSTKEGVCIGQSNQNMIDTYGDNYTNEDGMCVYRKDNMKLCFILDGDQIISIKYLSTVLDEQ